MRILDCRNNNNSNKTLLLDLLNKRNQNQQTEVSSKVHDVLTDIMNNGNKAVLKYTALFDQVVLNEENLRVTEEEFQKALDTIDQELLDVMKKAADNIESFHSKQKQNTWMDTEKPGIVLGQKVTSLCTVGVYVPGGTAPLPSSVLMNVIPAKVAGVKNIIMCTPPDREDRDNSAILAAAKIAGVTEVYRVGGAQAIAAMAYGTETIPKVDKITGPGNIYVQTAKKLVYGYCDIDMIAGPSEVLIVADQSANASYVAADLLSQAEHDILASSILVTDNEDMAKAVEEQLNQQLDQLNRAEITRKSLEDYGAIVITDDLKQAVDIVNLVAPEHLELCVENPFEMMTEVKNAGAIFIGNYSPEPLGDYYAGTNHVLPTNGAARFFSPLSVSDFTKTSSIIYYTREALEKVHREVSLFAEAETLDAHANAIKIRFKGNESL